MAWIELAAAIYLGVLTAFTNADGLFNRLFLKAPLPVFGAFLLADALSRLGYI